MEMFGDMLIKYPGGNSARVGMSMRERSEVHKDEPISNVSSRSAATSNDDTRLCLGADDSNVNRPVELPECTAVSKNEPSGRE